MIYLDYAATTPVDHSVWETYQGLVETYYGNPDSNHPKGVEVGRLLQKSREQTAKLLDVKASEIIYTSGASEANNLALKGIALQYQGRGKHIITSNIEHASILQACQQLEALFGFTVTYLPVDASGTVTLKQVQQAVRKDTILVSLFLVNNEIGSINPIAEIGAWLKQETRVLFHSDLVQAVGKHALPMKGLDLATISAHKIHGLKGSGMLYKKESLQLVPLISGGDQEFGFRAGTNNAPVNIVFAKTLRRALEAKDEAYAHAMQLRQDLKQKLQDSEIVWNSQEDASPFIMNLQTPLPSEIMMNALAADGYCVSAKSTCNTKSNTPSHVLKAIGLTDGQANHSIRISIDKEVTAEDIASFADALQRAIARFRT